MKKKNQNILSVLKEEDSFFNILSSQALLDKSQFHAYLNSIYDLHQEELNSEDKFRLSIAIWEVSLRIERLLGCHLDSNDIYKISNLSNDDIYQVRQITYYVANHFSYGKNIDKSLLNIGAWR